VIVLEIIFLCIYEWMVIGQGRCQAGKITKEISYLRNGYQNDIKYNG
jgi:hypothetical protein